MTTAPGFHAENYLRLREELLKREGRFDWAWCEMGDRPNCVACACVDLRGGQLIGRNYSTPLDIRTFIECTEAEAEYLFLPAFPCMGPSPLGEAFDRDVRNAVERLDIVARRYGVTPESAPAPAPETFTVTLQPEADFIAELRQFAAEVRKELETR